MRDAALGHFQRHAALIDTMLARRVIVTGKVQGVFFRAWFSERAVALGLAGWVRNRTDGTVEAAIQGSPEAVKEMVMLAHQGPPAARVERVTVSDDVPAGPLAGFEQRATR